MDKKVLAEVNARVPFACERQLALHDHECSKRITREHALLYAGRQIDEAWAVVLLCSKAHSVDEYMDCGILNKEINEWIALCRMTRKDEQRYPRVNWRQRRSYLCGKYGTFPLSTGRAKKKDLQ
jgi:hypothetical protein